MVVVVVVVVVVAEYRNRSGYGFDYDNDNERPEDFRGRAARRLATDTETSSLQHRAKTMIDKMHSQDRTNIVSRGDRATRPAGAKAHLLVIRGANIDLGRAIPLLGTVTIGRNRTAKLSLSDQGVSGRHAQVATPQPGSYVLSDLGSTNGTWVGGKRVASNWDLREGDKIVVGESMLLFTEAKETELGYLREPLIQLQTDRLTGLLSKRIFDETLDSAAASARLIKAPYAVLMMDIDRLRTANKRYGPAVASLCVQQIGNIIGEQIGAGGIACRYGGDDFMAMLKGADRAEAIKIAKRIRRAVNDHQIVTADLSFRVSISIGVAIHPRDGDWVLDLLAAADRALGRAKGGGRNVVATA